jgi:hypothetical protein
MPANNMPKIVVALSALILALAALAVWWLAPSSSAPATNDPEPSIYDDEGDLPLSPSGGGSGAATSVDQLSSTTAAWHGLPIRVKPFLPATIDPAAVDDGDYVLAEATDQGYRISYNLAGQSFLVALLHEPLRAARTAAEADLLARLGISALEACRLRLLLVVPAEVNAVYAGKNMGLTGCAGATDIPQ